jgi:hypothetical protein
MVSDWLKLRASTAKLEEAVTEAMGLVAAFISSRHGRQMTFELRREIRVYVASCMRNISAFYERPDRSPIPTPALIKAKLSFAGYYCNEFNLKTANMQICSMTSVRASRKRFLAPEILVLSVLSPFRQISIQTMEIQQQ